MAELNNCTGLPYPTVNISGGNISASFIGPNDGQPSTSRYVAFKTPFLLPTAKEGEKFVTFTLLSFSIFSVFALKNIFFLFLCYIT